MQEHDQGVDHVDQEDREKQRDEYRRGELQGCARQEDDDYGEQLVRCPDGIRLRHRHQSIRTRARCQGIIEKGLSKKPCTAGPVCGSLPALKTYIIIAGNIGAGKSTLVRMMCELLGWEPYLYDPVAENPYLADFYLDMKRWAFNSQVFFLTHRARSHRALMDSRRSVVQDRSFYEDAEIFARAQYMMGSLSERDWQTYQGLYHTLTTLPGAARPGGLPARISSDASPARPARAEHRGRHLRHLPHELERPLRTVDRHLRRGPGSRCALGPAGLRGRVAGPFMPCSQPSRSSFTAARGFSSRMKFLVASPVSRFPFLPGRGRCFQDW